jgi:hypothetical protein
MNQINVKDKLDVEAKQKAFNNLEVPFRNTTHRDDERIYINKRKKCENANAFAHKVNHQILDKNPRCATI